MFNDRYISSPSRTFTIGKNSIKEVDLCRYVGVEIHRYKSGSFSLARSELKKKAIRALCAMKNTVKKCKLSFRSLTTLLIDSLIKPIVLCDSPIHTITMSILKRMAKKYGSTASSGMEAQSNSHVNFQSKLSLLNSEKCIYIP
jgi:hypothetical protein